MMPTWGDEDEATHFVSVQDNGNDYFFRFRNEEDAKTFAKASCLMKDFRRMEFGKILRVVIPAATVEDL